MVYEKAQGNITGEQVNPAVNAEMEHLLTRALFKVDLGGDVATQLLLAYLPYSG